MTVAYIALGSNVDDRLSYLRAAKEALGRKMEITIVSPVYETEPVGTTEGGRFLNAILAARTELTPEEVLSLCLDIEQENGRTRNARNAPRTLDMDVLLYDDLVIDSPRMTVPHPRMHDRVFVLAPLADIAPDMLHPVLGVSMRSLLKLCGPEQQVSRTDHSL